MKASLQTVVRAALAALPGLGLALALSACGGGSEGLLVTACEPWGAASRSGVEIGDRLVGWRSGGQVGRLRTPLDLFVVEIEQGLDGPVTLEVDRRGHRRLLRLDGGAWDLETRTGGGDADPPGEGSDHTLRRLRAQAAAAAAAADPRLAAWWHVAEGDLLTGAGRFAEAGRAYAQARHESAGPAARAAVDDWQARRLIAAGRLDDAAAAERRALHLRAGRDPGGAAVAVSLYQLGRIAARRQRWDDEAKLTRAEAILLAMPRGRELLAEVLNLRGMMAWGRRDLDAAAGHYRAAASLLAGLGRENPLRANLLGNLGLVAELRGDMGEAAGLFAAAAALHARVDPESVDAAYAYNYLGILAKQKGDLAAAEHWYRRAEAVFEVALPDGVETAGMLNNLGNLALRRGELAAAERLHRRALAVRQRIVPGTADHAASLQNLGQVLELEGETERAEPYLVEARAIKARVVPDSLDYSNALTALGRLRQDQGRLDEAESLHREALDLRRAVAEGRWEWAENLFFLGEIALARGDRGDAEKLWRQAVDGIEQNRERPEWDPEERSGFAAPFQRYYRRLAALLAAGGRAREAFELLESARARALRSLLAARRLRHPAGLTAPRAARRDALREAQGRRLDEIAAALGEGAVLLAYSVAEDGTLLFVVAGGTARAPQVHRIPAGEEELRSRVAIFRALVERGRRGGAVVEPALLAQGRWLYERLVAPAENALAGAERIVIVPDGPLFSLPFAALVRRRRPTVAWLGGWRPLSIVPAAGVLVELGPAGRRARPPRRLVAFADPVYPPGGLAPLPGTRSEVSRLAPLFPGSLVYLGRDATEDRLGALPSSPLILHLAVHGLLDERFPLESALAFSTPAAAAPAREDGLLHAWEVPERLDLDADLVVLSACDSGRGRELPGEGILGLARAFQIAGARAVLASQWAVADRSTGELMVRFYRHLAAGRSAAAALAAAQRELADGDADGAGLAAARHPFAWAGFQLVGDGN